MSGREITTDLVEAPDEDARDEEVNNCAEGTAESGGVQACQPVQDKGRYIDGMRTSWQLCRFLISCVRDVSRNGRRTLSLVLSSYINFLGISTREQGSTLPEGNGTHVSSGECYQQGGSFSGSGSENQLGQEIQSLGIL